jgi:mono/diheme cytochrome c family protein
MPQLRGLHRLAPRYCQTVSQSSDTTAVGTGTGNAQARNSPSIEVGIATVNRQATSAALVGCLISLIGTSLATPPPIAEQDQGRAIYERHCADCHGPEGRGDGKQAISLSPRPGNLVSAQTSAKSDQELLKIIANGKPRTAMTGWNERLSDEEQRAVLAYIRSLVQFTRSATPPPPAP